MFELSKIVIPRVLSHWKELAYSMRCSIGDVEVFDKDGKGVHECCEQLFTNWLTTDHGPTPKTYQTLLKCIKKVDKLTAASEEIELIKGKDK